MPRRNYRVLNARERLAKGRCPVHNRHFDEDEGFPKWINEAPPPDAEMRAIAACRAPGCKVRAYYEGPDGPWELLPEFAHLLEDADGPAGA